MLRTLIYLACVGDASRIRQDFFSQPPATIPTSRFAGIARHALKEIPRQPAQAQAPVMQQSRQLAIKPLKQGSIKPSKVIKPKASPWMPTSRGGAWAPKIFASVPVELGKALNPKRSAMMSSIVQPSGPRQLLGQQFDKFKTGMRIPMSALLRVVPRQDAQGLMRLRNLAQTALDQLFAFLRTNHGDKTLPRVHVVHLGMVGLSAGEVAMRRQVFAIVKFANGKYRLLQGYGTSEPGSDLNTMLHSSIPFDEPFGDHELRQFESSLRASLNSIDVELGARADSPLVHEVFANPVLMYAPEKPDKTFALSLISVELQANSLQGGPNLPREQVDAESLVSEAWEQSNMRVEDVCESLAKTIALIGLKSWQETV